jgi:hypothetical protein
MNRAFNEPSVDKKSVNQPAFDEPSVDKKSVDKKSVDEPPLYYVNIHSFVHPRGWIHTVLFEERRYEQMMNYIQGQLLPWRPTWPSTSPLSRLGVV